MLKYEIRCIGMGDYSLNETNIIKYDLLNTVINNAINFMKEEDINGLEQYIKVYNGVELHWLSGKEIESFPILKIIPVYEGKESIDYTQNLFKAI